MPIYAIWGPTPMWADGYGVVGYAASREDAEAMIDIYIEECREYGPRSGYGEGGLSRDDYDVVKVDPSDLPEEMRGLPLDEIIDRLNERVD